MGLSYSYARSPLPRVMVDDVSVSLGRVTFSPAGLPASLGVDFAILETVGRDGDHRLSGQPSHQNKFPFVLVFFLAFFL